jgi:NADPH:quinone reductase-like Zn-dependent oxidoreductase
MPNAVVMTGYGPPEVLKWAGVLPEPGAGQVRIKVKAAGISPTDLALRAGSLQAVPLPPGAVLGFEAAGPVDAVGPGVTGTAAGDPVTALLLRLGGYAEYAVAPVWGRQAAVGVVARCRRAAQLGRGGGRCAAAAGRAGR